MTKPDEALIWARADAADMYDDDAPRVLAGEFDSWPDIEWPARTYRAGQAASAERIKALERLLGHFLGDFCDRTWDPEKEPEVIEARNLLKEADQ